MKNFKLRALFLCENVIIDKADKFSIIGIFTNINVKKLPTRFAKLTIIGFIDVNTNVEKTYKIDLKLKNPSGDEIKLNLPKLEGKTLKEKKQSVISIDLINLPFSSEGKHLFELYFDKDIIGKIPVNIQIIK